MRTLIRAAIVVAVVAALVAVIRRQDGRAIASALGAASWRLVGLGLVFVLLGIAAQIVRTWLLLLPTTKIPIARLIRYHLASCAATNLLPARAGEALRAYLLRAHEGVPVATTAGLVVAEYTAKIVTLAALAMGLPWLLPAPLPLPPRWVLIGTTFVVPLAVIAAIIAYRRIVRKGAPTWLRDLANGLRAAADLRLLSAILGLTMAAWLLEGAAIYTIVYALGRSIPVAGPILVLVSLNLALAVPSTPGRIGVFELGAAFGLRLLGLSEGDALAAALLCHLIQFVPTTVLGLAGLSLALSARRAREPFSSPR